MARGWESKTVADQIEAAEGDRSRRGARPSSPEETERRRKMEGLLLTRTRVQQELDGARNQRYRIILEQELSHLDQELARLSALGPPPAD